MKSLILAASVLSGCFNSGNVTQTTQPTGPADGGAKVSYLCVGMEKSQRFGECPGCEIDAKHLSALMSQIFGYKGDTLISEQATKAAVVSKLKDGIEGTGEDGLFLFFYSGHGGQEYLGGKEPDGADRMYEYLCLYDYHMLDDEIWDIVSKCKGRVFLYFDACHSATMFRTVRKPVNPDVEVDVVVPKTGKALGFNDRGLLVDTEDLVRSSGFTFRPDRHIVARALSGDRGSNPRLLCWSGCKEIEYSYGGSRGGFLTICVLNGFKKGISYGDLWTRAHDAVKAMEPSQNPVQTYIGGGFTPDMEAFR